MGLRVPQMSKTSFIQFEYSTKTKWTFESICCRFRSYSNSSRNLHSRLGPAALLRFKREDASERPRRESFKCNSHEKRISSVLLTVPCSVQSVCSCVSSIFELSCWKLNPKLVKSVPAMQPAVIMSTLFSNSRSMPFPTTDARAHSVLVEWKWMR